MKKFIELKKIQIGSFYCAVCVIRQNFSVNWKCLYLADLGVCRTPQTTSWTLQGSVVDIWTLGDVGKKKEIRSLNCLTGIVFLHTKTIRVAPAPLLGALTPNAPASVTWCHCNGFGGTDFRGLMIP